MNIYQKEAVEERFKNFRKSQFFKLLTWKRKGILEIPHQNRKIQLKITQQLAEIQERSLRTALNDKAKVYLYTGQMLEENETSSDFFEDFIIANGNIRADLVENVKNFR